MGYKCQYEKYELSRILKILISAYLHPLYYVNAYIILISLSDGRKYQVVGGHKAATANIYIFGLLYII